MPVDESGAFYDGFGWLHGRHTADAAQQIVEDLGQRGRLVEAGEITHRYPVCWRCGTELIFRLVDEWFIRCDEVREPMIEAARAVEWTPAAVRQADGGLAAQHGRLVHQPQALLGPAAAVLLLPGRPHDRDRLARGAARARRCAASMRLEELHRPWIDEVAIGCAECGAEAERLPDVGDCWLDAGIVPFSTLGWQNDDVRRARLRAGAGVGLTIADLPDARATGSSWFPADWVTEMREQIRLWFYSMLFMSVALAGETPYRRVLVLREGERRDRPADAQVVGQRDLVRRRGREDGRRRHALDVRGPDAGART